MKALFLVGGSGTRLRPFTDHLPKPMIPMMGRPLLERTFARLSQCGARDVVLSACYKPSGTIRYFEDGSRFDLDMTYVLEEEPLGTGGAIGNARQHLDDSFFVFNADILCDIDLADMLAFHRKRGADVTIAATWVEDPTAYGTISYDEGGRITKFKEKPAPHEVDSHYINAGIYLFEPDMLDYIPAGRPVSVEREVFPALLADGRHLAVYRDTGYWMDIGTPQKYVQAHRDIFSGECGIDEADFAQDGRHVADSAWVDTSVLAEAPVFVGRDAYVGHGTIMGGGVCVGDGVLVGRDCYLEDAILWPGARVPDGTLVQHCVAADINGGLAFFDYDQLGIKAERSLLKNEQKSR